MGLTIHYSLSSKTRSPERAKALVERMRQLALDLPFDSVDPQVMHLGPDVCQRPLDDLRSDQHLFSTVLDASQHVAVPWHRKQQASVTVQPLEIVSFWTVPGPGSEWASVGLARYPAEIEVMYTPRDDDRFIRTIKSRGSTSWSFDWKRWRRWLVANGHRTWEHEDDEKFQEPRKIKTHLGGWRYSSFTFPNFSGSAESPSVFDCQTLPAAVAIKICPRAATGSTASRTRARSMSCCIPSWPTPSASTEKHANG